MDKILDPAFSLSPLPAVVHSPTCCCAVCLSTDLAVQNLCLLEPWCELDVRQRSCHGLALEIKKRQERLVGVIHFFAPICVTYIINTFSYFVLWVPICSSFVWLAQIRVGNVRISPNEWSVSFLCLFEPRSAISPNHFSLGQKAHNFCPFLFPLHPSVSTPCPPAISPIFLLRARFFSSSFFFFFFSPPPHPPKKQ